MILFIFTHVIRHAVRLAKVWFYTAKYFDPNFDANVAYQSGF